MDLQLERFIVFYMFWNPSLCKDEVIRIGQGEREIVWDELEKTTSGCTHKLRKSFM